jgi:phytoene desaturase
MSKKAIVIGSGFAGLSSACFLAKQGFKVTLLEKNDSPGGRARQFTSDGFVFDMGPSWYWMPDVFEHFFESFGKKVSDYYTLERLDPSYSVVWENETWEIAADYDKLKDFFETIEPGSGKQLDAFMAEAGYKYEVGIKELVYKPGRSLTEFADIRLLKGLMKMDVLKSMKTHVASFFKNPKLQELMEFPVLFLGALPEKIPALYSLMNYADIKLGTWYPQGGMFKIVEGMLSVAKELGVEVKLGHEVTGFDFVNDSIRKVKTIKGEFEADVVVSGADYNHTEQHLLPKEYRQYSASYWDKRIMAPSSLLYYVGISTTINNIGHHTLFFDTDFKKHGGEIYTNPKWPDNPLFYASCPSVTDKSVAPEGSENLFFLIPTAAGLTGDTEELRQHYFDMILERFENHIGQKIKDSIVFYRSYSVANFQEDYHAFKGNAYGLANTLTQTANLKPSMKSPKIKNLYYTGQLTVPGPGVPPSLISGEVVAGEIVKDFKKL